MSRPSGMAARSKMVICAKLKAVFESETEMHSGDVIEMSKEMPSTDVPAQERCEQAVRAGDVSWQRD